MDLGAGLDNVEKRNFLALLGFMTTVMCKIVPALN
jgi:hypothetical protein